MPRIQRSQQQREEFLISEFCRKKGYRISRSKWQDKPDALLTLSKGKSRQRVAVEHTDYFNNTVAGQRSPLSPIDEFWQRVQRSLVRRISHRKGLAAIWASVRLKTNLPNWRGQVAEVCARELAKEIVAFLETHPIAPDASLRRVEFRSGRRHFEGYTTLESLVCSLWVRRFSEDPVSVSRSQWSCSNTRVGSIGVNIECIKSAIKNKNEKARAYDWGAAEEKWLLIVAGGGNIATSGGPCTQNVNWSDVDLAALCQQSSFDKIFFWERIRCWCKPLKPDRPIVNLGQ